MKGRLGGTAIDDLLVPLELERHFARSVRPVDGVPATVESGVAIAVSTRGARSAAVTMDSRSDRGLDLLQD